jgi:hypothetical protein
VVLFAAVHESGCGTNRTYWVGLMMSVARGRSEVAGTRSKDADDPERTSDDLRKDPPSAMFEREVSLSQTARSPSICEIGTRAV